jgi:ribosomal protein S18 acetylase RimI-like enzyme
VLSSTPRCCTAGRIDRIADMVPMFSPEFWDETAVGFPPPDALLVATSEASGDVVGYAAIRGRTGELFLLFVHPALGGRGIGRALLGAGHDALLAAGHHEVFLYTHKHNARALSVHAAAGLPTRRLVEGVRI